MATKKMDVPDIGNLLGKITEKRDSGELPKTEIQHVQPVKEEKSMPVKEISSKNGNTQKRDGAEDRGPGGRPSVKRDDIIYVKISPRIPKTLKKQTQNALVDELFTDKDGRPITTLDEIVALALTRLLAK